MLEPCAFDELVFCPEAELRRLVRAELKVLHWIVIKVLQVGILVSKLVFADA